MRATSSGSSPMPSRTPSPMTGPREHYFCGAEATKHEEQRQQGVAPIVAGPMPTIMLCGVGPLPGGMCRQLYGGCAAMVPGMASHGGFFHGGYAAVQSQAASAGMPCGGGIGVGACRAGQAAAGQAPSQPAGQWLLVSGAAAGRGAAVAAAPQASSTPAGAVRVPDAAAPPSHPVPRPRHRPRGKAQAAAAALAPIVTSVGTIGHPFTCNPPCKYARKPKGCKDGSQCTHCHECVWRRQDGRPVEYHPRTRPPSQGG